MRASTWSRPISYSLTRTIITGSTWRPRYRTTKTINSKRRSNWHYNNYISRLRATKLLTQMPVWPRRAIGHPKISSYRPRQTLSRKVVRIFSITATSRPSYRQYVSRLISRWCMREPQMHLEENIIYSHNNPRTSRSKTIVKLMAVYSRLWDKIMYLIRQLCKTYPRMSEHLASLTTTSSKCLCENMTSHS